MKVLKTLYLTLILLGTCFTANAQKFLWDLDFNGFFDNREFKAPYQTPQTFFGTRLSPELGLQIKDNHELMGGLSWVEDFGSNNSQKVDWSVYYRYNSPKFKATFGAFPRRLLIREFQPTMMYDSILYYTPYINGALFQYSGDKGYAEAYIDWRSKQTDTDREVFTMASSGEFGRTFLGGWYVMVTHFAKPKEEMENVNVIDNIHANPYIGLDFSHKTVFDSLYIKAGYLLALNRNRGNNVWHYSQGLLAELRAEWRFLGLYNSLYSGENQLPFYNEYGSFLDLADPFYRARFYDRLDIYGYFLRNKYVECKASCNLHFAGGRVQFQQQLLLKFYINQDVLSKQVRRNLFKF